ncbi:DUF3486 family protein [Arhodomonas sp. AD133]|uniref:DUF3486 family protein n=1 Tax=Arhodomonas sp. AD133 TaxID=3415009 RepID=UPI003EBC0F34
MPQRSAVEQLPDDIRTELDRRLAQSGFSGYAELAEWLTGQGYQISRSAVHRYGQRLERRMETIRASTEAARQIASVAPDEEDDRSAAVISMVQSDLFEAMLALQEAQEEGVDPTTRVALLSKAGRAVAEVSRASVNQKKFAAEVRRQTQQEAADAAETAARKAGLSDDGVAAMRAAILEGL